MRRWLIAAVLLSASVVHAAPEAWQSRCIGEMQRELAPLVEHDRLFRGGTLHYSEPPADPPFVIFELVTRQQEKLTASVNRGYDMPPRAWERDDQWNYPINPAIAWREVRALPDVEGRVIIADRAQGGAGASETQLATFRAAAKRSVDACMSAVSTWRAPEASIAFAHTTDDHHLERVTVAADGPASWSMSSIGGVVGENGILSKSEVDRVLDVLVAQNVCALRSQDDGGTWLHVASARLTCDVHLSETEWRTTPRAHATMDAILGLRATLRSHHGASP